MIYMAKRRRLKRKIRIIFNTFKLLFILFVIIYIIVKFYFLVFKKNVVEYIEYNNNKLTVHLYGDDKELYCILDNKIPNDNDNWTKSNNNECILDYVEKSILYIKNNSKIIYNSKKDIYFDIKNINTLYIAKGDKYNYYNYLIGNGNKIKIIDYDKDIISFNNNGIIVGLKDGETQLKLKYKDISYETKVIVTSIITKRPSEGYDYNKKYLTCNKYSKEENDLIDKILKSRIENVGYQTRAGVVEAARFLTLDFPYRINYFYENGRQTTNKVDGEGRYYHVGFYLDSSRYNNLTGSTTTNNKGPWGCSIYSYPAHRNIDNGLDCSGFVSWALLNGGFDVKDVGAGWSDKEDLTDFGEVKKLTKEISISDEIKVGDLLHSEAAGGHIGIIVGKDNNYYYVAQALWYDEIGVIITKIKKSELQKTFPHVVLMDKYYKIDGNLTNMW